MLGALVVGVVGFISFGGLCPCRALLNDYATNITAFVIPRKCLPKIFGKKNTLA
jgi:hypothetical protein